ncbi:hypothetical protein SAMN06295987_101457 [Novosphingobium mathurense]|uniref:Uncharacterized protein n=1 Tax=Novosphingobium mathurense TaxID=428990 RepID=A0A1U6GU38_9SPHN|nr:hypothetical protein SAMN06295987_101457 [Novosphingobium mathurense]
MKKAVPDWRDGPVGLLNEKGRTGKPVRPFAWSAAGSAASESLYRLIKIQR